jgi:probable F420-dependent oxidoreductase
MRISIASAQYGNLGRPESIIHVAHLAEQLGYDGIWVADRLLAPLAPSERYPASADGLLPEALRRMLDPLVTLSFLAAHTERISLGTSVLSTPLYSPLMLARQLTAIDVLSGGRLKVGLGGGWSTDERIAVGAPSDHRGVRNDEFIETLLAAWTADVVVYDGRFEHVPASRIDLKPVQRPHPPIYLAAFAPASMRRVARYADGWNPGAMPFPVIARMFDVVRQMTVDEGRDPDELQLIIRGNIHLTSSSLDDDRAPFSGTVDQIADDVGRAQDVGADEVILDAGCSSAGATTQSYCDFIADIANRLITVSV